MTPRKKRTSTTPGGDVNDFAGLETATKVTTKRSATELRAAQIACAVVVVEQVPPELQREREVILGELLGALGLDQKVDQLEKRKTCGPDVGTVRGYRRHVGAYQTPCNACLKARRYEQDDNWKALGIDPRSEIVTPN